MRLGENQLPFLRPGAPAELERARAENEDRCPGRELKWIQGPVKPVMFMAKLFILTRFLRNPS